MNELWARIAEAQARAAKLQQAGRILEAGNKVGLTTHTVYGPVPVVQRQSLIDTKRDQLAAAAVEKLRKIRPEAQTEVGYQLQNWVNPIKSAINYLLPEESELNKYELDRTTGKEYLLNEDTNKREFEGKFKTNGSSLWRDPNDWETTTVTDEFVTQHSLGGTHGKPLYFKDKNDQFTSLENKWFVKDWTPQEYADAMAYMDSHSEVVLNNGRLRDKNGNLVKEQPGRVYKFASNTPDVSKLGRSIGAVRHKETGEWVIIPAEARYIPGLAAKISGGAISESYGWAPGTKGVNLEDINKYSTMMSMEDTLMYEGFGHAKAFQEGSNTNKMLPWHTQFTSQQEADYGSGKSEYRNDSVFNKVKGNAKRGEALVNNYKQSDEYLNVLYNYETSKIKGDKPNEIVQTVRDLPGAVVKGVVDMADTIQEMGMYIPQTVYNQMYGTNIDIDLFDDKDKAELKNKINEFTGYIAEWDEADQKKALRQLDSTGINLKDPKTWSKIWELDAATKIGKAAATMLANPSMTVENVVPIIGAAVGLSVITRGIGVIGAAGLAISTVGKIVKMGTPGITRTVAGTALQGVGKTISVPANAIDKTIKGTQSLFTTKADKVLAVYNKAKAADTAGSTVLTKAALASATTAKEALTIAEKSKRLAATVVGGSYMSNADFMNRMNADITVFRENNDDNRGMEPSKLLTTVLMNKFAAEWGAANIKSMLLPTGAVKETAKKELTTTAERFINNMKGLLNLSGRYSKNTLNETTQEFTDGVIQVVNQNYGSDAYKDKTWGQVIGDASTEIIFGALAGAVGGVHMTTVGLAGDVKDSMDKRKESQRLIQEAKDKAEAAKIRTEWMTSKGEDYTTYDEAQRVDEPDAEVVDIEGTETTIFTEPVNLKVESTDAKEYAAKLEAQKDAVIQSLYTIDPKTGKTIGLSESAKTMTNEQLETRVNKVNNWLGKYAEEYTIGEDKATPKSIADQLIQYTEGSAIHWQEKLIEAEKPVSKITDEQKALDKITSELAEERAKENGGNPAVLAKLKEKQKVAKDAYQAKLIENMVNKAQNFEPLDKATKEEMIEEFKFALKTRTATVNKDGKVEYAEYWPEDVIDKVAVESAERLYKINGKYRFDVNLDVKTEVARINAKTKKSVDGKQKVLDSAEISGKNLVSALMNADIKEAIEGTDAQTQGANIKYRVLGVLNDPKSAKPIKDLTNKITATVEKHKDKFSEVFTQEALDEGDAEVLLFVTLGAINDAIVTDTEARRVVKGKTVSIENNLDKGEYWAGESAALIQIGKDFLTSRGIALGRGNANSHNDTYIKLGRAGVEAAIAGGLVQRSVNPVSTVVSNDIVLNENSFVGKKQAMRMADDNKFVNLLTDHGLQIIDSTNSYANKTIGNDNLPKPYNNKVGNIAARIGKLLVPSNYVVPEREAKSKEEIKVVNSVQLFDNGDGIAVLDTIQKFQEDEYKIQDDWVEFFEDIVKNMGEQSLEQYLASKDGEVIKGMLGLTEYGTEIPMLADTDKGVTGGLKDIFNGILNNIGALKAENGKGFHLSYSVGGNTRVVVQDTVINMQNDKVIAAQIVTSAKLPDGQYDILGDTQNNTQDNTQNKEAIFDTYVEMLNELGFKAKDAENAKNEYEEAYDQILTEKDIPTEYWKDKESSKGQKIVYLILNLITKSAYMKNGKLDIEKVAQTLNEKNIAKIFPKLGGKATIKTIAILQGFKVMRETKGKKTSYIPGSDAKASGVMISLMNILGYDKNITDESKKTKTILQSLGIEFDKTGKILHPKDAYNLLQEKVLEMLNSLAGNDIASANTTKEKKLINELGELGIDTRELAKYIVMTWFYSAGSETIQLDMANTVIENVIRSAYKGDEKALDHIAGILKEAEVLEESKTLLPSDLLSFEKDGKEHIALIKAYKAIGAIYEKQLVEAFPGVALYKKQMKNIFDTMEKEGGEYVTGWLRGASNVLYPGNGNARFNVFKRVTHESDITEEDLKGKEALKESLAKKQLITEVKRVWTWTSILPLLAQNVDFAQLEFIMRELYKKYKGQNDFAPFHRHDDVRVPMYMMNEIGKDTYNEAMVTIAKNYDFTEVLIKSAEDTLKNMQNAAATAEKTGNADEALNRRIERFEEAIANWKDANAPRIEYKQDILKNTKVELIGITELKSENSAGGVTTEQVKAEPKPERRTAEDKLRDTAKEAKEGVVFDTEFSFNTTNNTTKPKQIYELAYQKAGGVTVTVNIKNETVTEETYYNDKDLKAWEGKDKAAEFAKKYPGYKTLAQVQKTSTSDSAIELVDAVKQMLEDIGEKKLVGYAQLGNTSDNSVLLANMPDGELKNALTEKLNASIDIYATIGDYRVDNSVNSKIGRQSEIADILEVKYDTANLHTAKGDLEVLHKIVEALTTADKFTLEKLLDITTIMEKRAIEVFKEEAKTDLNKAVINLINELVKLGRPKILRTIATAKKIKWKRAEKGEGYSMEETDEEIIITLAQTMPEETVDMIIDHLGHELEHANSAGLIEAIANNKEKRKELVDAYNTIKDILVKVEEKGKTEKIKSPRLNRILAESEIFKRVAETVAVIRGEVQGSEEMVQELIDLSFKTVVIDKLINAAKLLIATVREMMNIDTPNVNIPDVDKLVQAVETLHRAGLASHTSERAMKTYTYEKATKIESSNFGAGDMYSQTEYGVTAEELKEIDKANKKFMAANKQIKVGVGNLFSYSNNVITLDRDANETDTIVYMAHEIVHAKTIEWLANPANKALANKLEKAIDKVLNKLNTMPINSPTEEQIVLTARLTWASGGDKAARTVENVAVLAAEPAMRRELLKLLPEQERRLIDRILDKIKEWFGKELPMDGQRILKLVDKIVVKAEKRSKVATISNKKEVIDEVMVRLTALMAGKKMEPVQAIINKIKDC